MPRSPKGTGRLIDEVAGYSRVPGSLCWAQRFDPGLVDQIEECSAAGWSDGTIQRLLADKGIRLGLNALGHHRRGHCKCGSSTS